jgi:hypothetical protein
MSQKQSLSPAAWKLILDYEVGGGEAYYRKYLARPSWPGGASGVTIAIGIDLGYTSRERFERDWRELSQAVRGRLLPVIGFKGRFAAGKVASVRDIEIPWPLALAVFRTRTVPYWIAQTVAAFPRSVELPDDAFGALVSLVFNRGPALRGRNREEMQDIGDVLADGVQCGDLKLIARELREMKRIWAGKGLPGLGRRREAEAKLVEAAR